MLLEKITKEELEFMECIYTPRSFAECLFSDPDNLSAFEENKFLKIRLGQLPLLSYEYLIDDDPKLSDKQNFKLREGAGNLLCYGGRNWGKTFCSEKLDSCESLMLNDGYPMALTSYDDLHIQGVLDSVADAFENHPILRCFKLKRGGIRKKPSYKFKLRNGASLEGINMALTSRNPGSGFFQKHFKKLWKEEGSFETEEVYKKRIDSRHELGCVERENGMTNFTKHSPAGRAFYDLKNKPFLMNLPQYINPYWDAEEREKALRKYGGKNTIGFRVFVEAEVVEEGISVFDMERVRMNYNDKKYVKFFEISKNTFKNYSVDLVIERPKNAIRTWIAADIGRTSQTEIIILFEIANKFCYHYNITLYNLTDKQQFEIFEYIGRKLNAEFIGIDCGEGTGVAIFGRLEEIFSKENLIWYDGSKKIAVDYEKNENNDIKIGRDGQPIYRELTMAEWSVLHLQEMFYDYKFIISIDYKFDKQINSVVSLQSRSRPVFNCVSEDNHLWDAWKVFSIMHWMNEFNLIKPIQNESYFKGIVW